MRAFEVHQVYHHTLVKLAFLVVGFGMADPLGEYLRNALPDVVKLAVGFQTLECDWHEEEHAPLFAL
ncbi:hypothetical protein KSF_083960 [Reticulibacter mediterranei]|uniref:Uncharacterized protein n=1 Tax=Reticulibacter mediterranei TaxID=2778369 RepID=A0A8J3N786_9CHLR|nr:hypothetical protein KSF_083960 [Reticulibacter mediterranei]